MSHAHNPVIHFLGSTSPVFPFFKDYICSTSTYSGTQLCAYSRHDLSLLHGELRLDSSLLTNFTAGDILISCIPIEVASAVLRALIAKKKSPSLSCLTSSSSVLFKLKKRSRDALDYLHFVLGEIDALDTYLKMPSNHKLVILRPTMLWGMRKDKNIDFIHRMLSTVGFFPVSTNSKGLRSPLHFCQFAEVLVHTLNNDLKSGIYPVMSRETMTYRQLVLSVKSTVRKSSFILPIPHFVIKFCSLFSKYLPVFILSPLEMICRHSHDLVVHDDSICLFPSSSSDFLQLLKATY